MLSYELYHMGVSPLNSIDQGGYIISWTTVGRKPKQHGNGLTLYSHEEAIAIRRLLSQEFSDRLYRTQFVTKGMLLNPKAFGLSDVDTVNQHLSNI